jgi:hypothetical protein
MPDGKKVELPEWSRRKPEYFTGGLRLAWQWARPALPLLLLVIALKILLVRRGRSSRKRHDHDA